MQWMAMLILRYFWLFQLQKKRRQASETDIVKSEVLFKNGLYTENESRSHERFYPVHGYGNRWHEQQFQR